MESTCEEEGGGDDCWAIERRSGCVLFWVRKWEREGSNDEWEYRGRFCVLRFIHGLYL